MSKTNARKAKKDAENAQASRRAGLAALLSFGGLMVIGVAGALLMTRSHVHQHGPRTVGHDEEFLVDLGNTRCPTCADAAAADVVVDWHHLRVHLARHDCEAAFSAKPEESLDRSGIDWRDAARAAHGINHARGDARETSLSRAKERWHVIPPGEPRTGSQAEH